MTPFDGPTDRTFRRKASVPCPLMSHFPFHACGKLTISRPPAHPKTKPSPFKRGLRQWRSSRVQQMRWCGCQHYASDPGSQKGRDAKSGIVVRQNALCMVVSRLLVMTWLKETAMRWKRKMEEKEENSKGASGRRGHSRGARFRLLMLQGGTRHS